MRSKLKLSKYTVGIFALAFLLLSSTPIQAIDEEFYSGNDILFYNPDLDSTTCVAPSSVSSPNDVSVDKNFSLGNDKSLRPVKLLEQLMSDYNLTDFQAAGIVGNFMWESGGQHLPPNINEGSTPGPPKFSGGYGWAQWTGGRQVAFIEYAVTNGLMANKKVDATDAANYGYLTKELKEGSAESKAIPAIRTTGNVNDAAASWEEVFERAGDVKLAERQELARKVLTAFKSGTGVSMDSSGPGNEDTTGTGCRTQNGELVASAVFDKVSFPLAGTKKVVVNSEIFQKNTTDRAGHPYIAYDILAPVDTKVVAFADGVVTSSSVGSYGQSVSIYNEKTGVVVFYQHMTPGRSPKVGATIKAGDNVGTVVSEKDFPDAVVPHLHIDASKGNTRVPCSRGACSESAQALFVDIGPDLYSAYQTLPD